MRLTGSRGFARPAPTPTMPPGLVELMEGLAKDVLKHNPENVYEFCAGHMQKLLEIRDGPAPPPKKLSLEQKIANAQEKIRQRMKYRHLQRDKSEQSNENHELEDEPPVAKVSMESTSPSAIEAIVKVSNQNTYTAIQPLEEIASEDTSVIQPIEKILEIQDVAQTVYEEKFTMGNEFELSHESDAIITNNETSTDEASQVAQGPEDIVVAAQKLDLEYAAEKNVDEIKESVGFDTKQISDIETNVNSLNVTDVDVQSKNYVAQKLDTEAATDKNIEEVKENVGVDTKQISDIKANVESRNVADVDVQTKNYVAQNLDSADPTEKNIGEVKENDGVDTKQISDIKANVESRNVADVDVQTKNYVAQNLDSADPTEKNIGEVKENDGVDTKQISDIEANIESRNVVDVDVQSKNDVAQKLDTKDPTEKNIEEVKVNVVDTKQISDIESRNVADVDVQTKNYVAQNLNSADPTEKNIGEVKENDGVDTKQISDIESRNVVDVDVQSKNVVTQKLDIEDPAEKNIEEVKENVGVDTKRISDIEVNVESRNVTDTDVQSKDGVKPFIESAGNIPQSADNHEAQMKESEPTISGIGNNAEEKVDNLNDGVLEKEVAKVELNEAASTPSLANINDTVLSPIDDDIKTTEKNVVEEEKIVKKEGLTDTKHEEIRIKTYATKIEPEESVNGVFEQQEIIKEDESADIHPEVLPTEKGDQIESNASVDDLTRASEDNIDDQDHAKVLFQSKDATVKGLTINQQEIQHQNETVSKKNLIISPTDTETPEKSHPQISETGANITENQVIASGKTEQATVDESLKNDDVDDHKSQVNYETEIDKQLSDDIDKLPEQERSYRGDLIVKDPEETQDNTTTVNKNDTIIEGDETPESTAVSGMDLETAAITIQKVFRTFLFSKSRASTLDDTVNENSLDEDIEKKDEPEYILTSSNLNKERRTLGISRMDTVLQTVNEEKSLSLSDDSSLSSAATTIQAHVRGFLVRNRLASNKTASTSSLVNSEGPSTLSLDGDVNEPKKTVLNIHIVPERGQFMSRDESLLTSIDLPLDNSPPSSINLHPLGYDKSAERRKQLKREDAVQSISPPSNNSGKLSEEIDSVKDTLNDSIDVDVRQQHESVSSNSFDKPQDADTESCDTTLTISSTAETVVDADTYNPGEVLSSPDHNMEADNKINEVVSSSDENDVVTRYPTITEKTAKVASVESENDEKPKLVHSGEFHDIVVQTQVKRSESSVVREFKNVLVYFLLWDKT